jgi:hypothetical protein
VYFHGNRISSLNSQRISIPIGLLARTKYWAENLGHTPGHTHNLKAPAGNPGTFAFKWGPEIRAGMSAWAIGPIFIYFFTEFNQESMVGRAKKPKQKHFFLLMIHIG